MTTEDDTDDDLKWREKWNKTWGAQNQKKEKSNIKQKPERLFKYTQ